MEDNEKDKKNYEISFLVKSEDDIPGVVSFLSRHNAEAVTEPRAKKLALAYEIKGNKEAVFAYCHCRASGADVKNLERDFIMRHDVIRSLIISLSSKKQEVVRRDIPERKPISPQYSAAPRPEMKTSSPVILSNEALTKKIEEILK